MRRRLLRLTTAALLVGLAASLTAPGLTSPAQAVRPTLSGVITGHPDGRPLADIEVCASGDHSFCAVTGTDGRYTMAVPTGSYTIRARDRDLYGDWVSQTRPGGSLRIDRDRRVDLSMRPGARVHFWLQTRDGGPIPEPFSVRAYPVDANNRIVNNGSWLGNARPGAARTYTQVALLPAGRYVFKVESDDLASSWYPFTSSAAKARRLSLAEGEELTLDPVELARGSTLVVSSTGPKGRAEATEAQLFDESGHEVFGREEAAGRRTRFAGLPPGRYRIRHTERERTNGYVQWHPSGKARTAARDVVIGEGTTHAVTTRLTYPSLRVTKKPRLVRDLGTVNLKRGRWSPKPTRYSYEWYVNGKKKYHPFRMFWLDSDRDRGKKVKACVTAHRKKYASTRVCTKSIRMPRGEW